MTCNLYLLPQMEANYYYLSEEDKAAVQTAFVFRSPPLTWASHNPLAQEVMDKALGNKVPKSTLMKNNYYEFPNYSSEYSEEEKQTICKPECGKQYTCNSSFEIELAPKFRYKLLPGHIVSCMGYDYERFSFFCTELGGQYVYGRIYPDFTQQLIIVPPPKHSDIIDKTTRPAPSPAVQNAVAAPRKAPVLVPERHRKYTSDRPFLLTNTKGETYALAAGEAVTSWGKGDQGEFFFSARVDQKHVYGKADEKTVQQMIPYESFKRPVARAQAPAAQSGMRLG